MDNKKQLWIKKDTLYCNNCGRYGHIYKKCFEPLLSYGLICIDTKDEKINDFFISKYKFPIDIQTLKNICILKYIQKNINCNNKKDLEIYEEKVNTHINIIMMKQKFTPNFINLIKGQYNIELEYIIKLFNTITQNEYNNILTKEFDELWENIGNTIDGFEYNKSKEHYKLLSNYILPQIKHKINIINDNVEWEFPKGKRLNNETNLECSQREFEKNIKLLEHEYIILDRIYPIIETVKGIDGIEYKYIYYIALLNKNITIQNNNELGEINSKSLNSVITLFKNYTTEKNEILNNLLLFFMYNIRYLEKFYHEKN